VTTTRTRSTGMSAFPTGASRRWLAHELIRFGVGADQAAVAMELMNFNVDRRLGRVNGSASTHEIFTPSPPDGVFAVLPSS